MIFSGNRYRSLLRDNKFSAEFDLSFSNATGRSEVGFSGDGKRFLFSFTSGKVFDHEGRYFYSYVPNEKIILNTEFSGRAYGYSVNEDRVLFSGLKDDFYVDRFFVNTTGCNIDASVSIFGNKPTFSLVLNPSFITGSPITGHFISNSVSGVRIFTGEFADGSNLYFTSLPTGLIRAGVSGQAVLRQIVTGLGDFYTSASFETTAGAYEQDVRISGVAKSYINYIFQFQGSNTLSNLAQAQLTSGLQKIGQATLNYGYDTNDSTLIPASLPIDISLSYYSGNTGYYGQVSSVSLISGGFGYLSAPTIIFSGGFTENLVQAFSSGSDLFRRPNSVPFTFYSGQPIAFYKPSGSVLPLPMIEDKTYYVRDLFTGAPPNFAISETPTGAKFDITNTGSGNFYFYDPTKVASAEAVLGTTTNYGSVASVRMNYYGSGYTSAPTVIFSGGTGILNNNVPVVASGIAQMSMYTKSFSGFFNLYSGYAGNVGNVSNLGNVIPVGMVDYRASSFFSGTKYTKTGSSIPDEDLLSVVVSYTPSFDQDIMVSKLVLSGISGNVIEAFITGAK
jgi:hypothetical protein